MDNLFFCLIFLFIFISSVFSKITKEEVEKWVETALISQDNSVKIYILDNVSDCPSKKFYPVIKKLLNSQNDNVKLKSAYVLYKVYKDTSAINQIVKFLLEKPELKQNSAVARAKMYLKNQLRAEAAKMLGELGDEKVLDVLSKTVKDDDGNVADASYFAIALLSQRGKIKPLPEIKEFFYSGLTDINPKVRLQAVKYLGELKYQEAALPLSLRLKDTDKQVVIEAIRSLGKLGDISVVEELMRFKSHTESTYRVVLAEALGDIAKNIYNSTDTTKVNMFLKIKSVLNGLLSDTNGMVRVASSKSLLSLGDRTVIEILKKGLQSNDTDVIIYCIETLGKYGNMEDIELIEDFVKHRDINISSAAYINILKIYWRN